MTQVAIEIIRRLREARGLTHDHLADRMDISSTTIAEWESGAATPLVEHLSDLAYIFGCSSEDLLGHVHSTKIFTNALFHHVDRGIEDGWWGHFGVRVPGHDLSRWYPITLGTAETISQRLRYYNDGEWVVAETLNNRILAINPVAVARLWLLDDSQDEPLDDWSVPIDGYCGQPAEFYKALDEYCSAQESVKMSKLLAKAIEAFTEEWDLGEDEIMRLLMETHVCDRNGNVTSYYASEGRLLEALDALQLGVEPAILDLSSEDFESYFSTASLVMVDMPRMLILGERNRIAEREQHS